MSRSFVFALLVAHFVAAARTGLLEKRDTPFVPQRVNIPLSFDSLGRYVATVSMGPNPGQQHFNFTMTTQTGLTYVAGAQCSSCSGTNLYDQSKSTAAHSFSTDPDVGLLGQTAAASVIKEDCQLRLANNSLWNYPNQTIVVVHQPGQGALASASDAQVGTDLAGLIGLATNRQTPPSGGNSSLYSAQFGDSIAGQWLSQHPTALNFSFGMQIGKPQTVPRSNASTGSWLNTQNNDPGVLHWLQPDSTAYDASKLVFVNTTLVTDQMPFTNSSGDWYVSIDGWVLQSGENQISNSKSVVATVDPMYADLYLPLDQAQLIHDAIPGAVLHPDLSSLGTLSQAWTVPCNSTFTYAIVVGDQTFTVDEDDLVIELLDGSCVSAIEAWTDADQTHYVFGARFLSTLYVIFNIPQDGSDSMGFAPRSSTTSKKSNHIGAIVGGTIGGVAFVIIAGFAFFYLMYRHRHGSHRITPATYDDGQEIEKPEGTVQPFPLSTTTPTTVRFGHAAQSSIGSDGLPSPSSMPMLLHQHDSLEVAPPSYEVSEQIRHSQSDLPLPSARSEKTEFASRYANVSSSRVEAQDLVSPVDDDPDSSGSNTVV